jgi:hypothetical protein
MEWIKKHFDAALVIAVIGGSFLWIDSKFEKVNEKFEKIGERLSAIENDLSTIKAIMILKGIIPSEFAHIESEGK